MMKLKLQYFDYLMWRTNSMEKTLVLGKIEGKRRREKHKMRWQGSITNSMDTSLSKLQEIVKERGDWPATVYRISKNQTWPCDWQQEEEFIYLLEVFWLLFSITISNSSVRLSILLNQSWKIMYDPVTTFASTRMCRAGSSLRTFLGNTGAGWWCPPGLVGWGVLL